MLLGAPFPPCSISRLASHPSASRVGLRVRAWAYGPDSTRLHLAAARQAGSGASSRPRDWCRAHLSLIILTAMHAVVSLRIFACVLVCVASVAGAADGLRPGEMWCQLSAVRLQPAASLRVAFGQGLFSLLREGGGAETDDRKRADSDQRRGWGRRGTGSRLNACVQYPVPAAPARQPHAHLLQPPSCPNARAKGTHWHGQAGTPLFILPLCFVLLARRVTSSRCCCRY